jgi:hypothetical protein
VNQAGNRTHDHRCAGTARHDCSVAAGAARIDKQENYRRHR